MSLKLNSNLTNANLKHCISNGERMWSKHLKLDVQEEFSSGEIETKKVKRKENS